MLYSTLEMVCTPSITFGHYTTVELGHEKASTYRNERGIDGHLLSEREIFETS